MNLYEAATKLLKENVALKKGERIIVVSDRKNCAIFNSICKATKQFGAELTKVHITKSRTHSSPLPQLKEIFNKSDVIIGITDKSISHSPETRIARKKYGVRVISIVEVDEELFLKSSKANKERVKNINKKFLKKLKNCKEIKVTTNSGTNIKAKIPRGGKFEEDDGDSTKKERLNNFPYGEVAIAPINIINGILVIDFSRTQRKTKLRLKLKNGKIIEYDKKAKKFIEYLKKFGGEKALRVVELGFGTNPEHKKIIGKIIHDEKIFGSAHVAFGGFGAERKCSVHEDVILLKPIVYVDNKKIIENGELLN